MIWVKIPPEVQLKADKLKLIGKEVLVYNNILITKSTSIKDTLDDVVVYCDIDGTELRFNDIPGLDTFLPEHTRLIIKGKGKLSDIEIGSAQTTRAHTQVEEIVLDIDTSQIEYFDYTFANMLKLKNIVFKRFSTESMKTSRYMFSGSADLTSLDLSKFNTSNLTQAIGMFDTCFGIKELDLSSFDTRQLVTMKQMFHGCWALRKINLSSFHTPNLRDMSEAFSSLSNINSIDISTFDLNNVVNMSKAFSRCTALSELKLPPSERIHMNKLEWFNNVFEDCISLTHLDLKGFQGESVIGMASSFSGCSRLRYIDLRDLNPVKLNYIQNICYGDIALETLDLRKLSYKYLAQEGSLMDRAVGGLNIILRRQSLPSCLADDKGKQQWMMIIDYIKSVQEQLELYNPTGLKLEKQEEERQEEERQEAEIERMRLQWSNELSRHQIKEITNQMRVYIQYYLPNTDIKDEYTIQAKLLSKIDGNGVRVYSA